MLCCLWNNNDNSVSKFRLHQENDKIFVFIIIDTYHVKVTIKYFFEIDLSISVTIIDKW